MQVHLPRTASRDQLHVTKGDAWHRPSAEALSGVSNNNMTIGLRGESNNIIIQPEERPRLSSRA